MDLDVWACPVCSSELSESSQGIVCRSEGRTFRQIDGLMVLVRPDQESAIGDAEHLAEAWKKTKWGVPRELVPRLPYVLRPGWRQKALSFRKLLEVLGPANARKVVDIGAGTGWLSHRLAEAGFRCYATDVCWDPDVGLGAASTFDGTPHNFERALATLDRWPFRSASVDIAICNASLQYLADLHPALAEAKRVLRPSGVFVEMNAPVHRDAASAERASRDFIEGLRKLGGFGPILRGHRHFLQSGLEDSLGEYFSSVLRHEPAYGFWFKNARAIEGAILGMELASFPIYEARVP